MYCGWLFFNQKPATPQEEYVDLACIIWWTQAIFLSFALGAVVVYLGYWRLRYVWAREVHSCEMHRRYSLQQVPTDVDVDLTTSVSRTRSYNEVATTKLPHITSTLHCIALHHTTTHSTQQHHVCVAKAHHIVPHHTASHNAS